MPKDRAWTLREALEWTREYLGSKGDEAPRRSAEWLLSAATGLSRVQLYANHDRPLSHDERSSLREAVKRRAEGEPLQYVTGEVAFRHVVLHARPGVFIPRPETEVLVDLALAESDRTGARVAVDACTGSGAVAISLAFERPELTVYATELDAAAASLARENADRYGLTDRVRVFQGDLLAPIPSELAGTVGVIVANPPYVPSADCALLPREVQEFEPHTALDGGPDGLSVIRRIAAEAGAWLARDGVLLVEADETRVADADRELRAWYEEVETKRDLTDRDRFVVCRVPRPSG